MLPVWIVLNMPLLRFLYWFTSGTLRFISTCKRNYFTGLSVDYSDYLLTCNDRFNHNSFSSIVLTHYFFFYHRIKADYHSLITIFCVCCMTCCLLFYIRSRFENHRRSVLMLFWSYSRRQTCSAVALALCHAHRAASLSTTRVPILTLAWEWTAIY